jgi:hypothetical protein
MRKPEKYKDHVVTVDATDFFFFQFTSTIPLRLGLQQVPRTSRGREFLLQLLMRVGYFRCMYLVTRADSAVKI